MENMKNFTIIYKDGKVVNQNTLTSVKQIMELDRLNINVVINNLNNDILLDNTKLVETLVKCELVEDIDSITINGDYVETDLGEYLVFDNYEDAENEAVEQCKQIIELDRLNINVVINNLNNDILLDNTKLVETLVKCDLVEDIESISITGDYVETDLGEYLVFDN